MKIDSTPSSSALPPFMKGFVSLLLLLIPVLGYLILRSDPVVYSNNIERNAVVVKQVQEFAAFIEKNPEWIPMPAQKAAEKVVIDKVQLDDAREQVRELGEIWRQTPPQHDELWRNQIDRLLDLAEQTGSEDALDLLQPQILEARVHSDDLNREKADRWVERYLKIEKRESKIREMSDLYQEKVQNRVDQDERKARESN